MLWKYIPREQIERILMTVITCHDTVVMRINCFQVELVPELAPL